MDYRKKQLIRNTWVGLVCQCVTIVCGFVLPRIMLTVYGSKVNGTVSSITQFLSIISFMQMGVGAVVQSALYEPLAINDNDSMSRIYVSAQRFFRTIAKIFGIYVIALFFIYPTAINHTFDFKYTASLILILSINLFLQYYYGLANQLLLMADQKSYIPLSIDIVTIIINTIVSVALIKNGFSIQIVKFISALIFIIRPLFLSFYVKSKYGINYDIKYDVEPIKQKWNGFAQHLASTVMDNTDVMILTLFSRIEDVSIYNVYNLVVFGVRQLIVSLTTGVQSFFGNLLARENRQYVLSLFEIAEVLFHVFITVVFSAVCVLIVPFISLYTRGVSDANYILPKFALIISLAQGIYCYRLVYFIIIKAAGHYKETQQSALIEMIINLSISVIGVIRFGLIGVAIGTLIAVIYRTGYFVVYLHRNILYINKLTTLFRFVADIFSFFIIITLSKCALLKYDTYIQWVLSACMTTLACAAISILINVFINKVTTPGLNRKVLKSIQSMNKRS